MRRSELYASASFTSASSRGSLSVASQLSATPPGAPGEAQFAGGVAFGTASFNTSSRCGGSWSAQALKANAATAKAQRLGARIVSVQLEDQVVRVRTHADDHLAQDVQERRVLGVYGRIAGGAAREEELLVAIGDVELHREALLRRADRRGGGKLAVRLDLPGARGPDDRIDLAFHDAAGIRLQRELGLVARLDLVQLVLSIERDDSSARLDEPHHRRERNSRNEAAGTKLEVDHVAVAGRPRRGLVEVPFGAFELRADLGDARIFAIDLRPQLL